MPSGKQVLLKILQDYSQQRLADNDLEQASETIRSALCGLCSTSSETMEEIQEMGWLSYSDDGELVKQGLGLVKADVFLSDLFEELIEDNEIPDRIKERFPELTQQQYSSGLDMIWWFLSSVQYWEELSPVENGGVLEDDKAKEHLNNYKNWLKRYEKEPW